MFSSIWTAGAVNDINKIVYKRSYFLLIGIIVVPHVSHPWHQNESFLHVEEKVQVSAESLCFFSLCQYKTRGWFEIDFYFQPYLEKWSNFWWECFEDGLKPPPSFHMIGDGHQPDSLGVYIHVRRIRYRRWDFPLKVGRLWSPKKFYTFPRTQRWRTSNAWWNSRWTNQRKCHVCSGPSSMFTRFLWVVSKICFQDIRSVTLITIIHVAQGTGTFPESVKWFPSENVGWHWKREATLFPFFLISKRLTNMKRFFF